MHPARIAELLAPFLATPLDLCHSEPAKAGEEPAFLSPAQLHDISTYIDILLRWNARINLTAIRDPEEIVTRHFGESLFAARHLFPRSSSVSPVSSACPDAGRVVDGFAVAPTLDTAGNARADEAAKGTEIPAARRPPPNARLADVGSGAGFPGIPIKLWAPQVSLTLVESNHKKTTFLREVTRALTLTDVNIQTARAEALTGTTFNVVTLRAVERFETILPTAATLISPGGRLALLIGSAQEKPARASLPDLTWSAPTPVPLSRSRILLIAHRRREPNA
jgi:16S rRNA (guanine527-N7)-methyltransferase